MDVLKILEEVKSGALTTAHASELLKNLSYEDLNFAKVDHHRQIRTGYPEVIFCQGKTTKQISEIINKIKEKSNTAIIGTRVTKDQFNELSKSISDLTYYEDARIIFTGKPLEITNKSGYIIVATGGTADIPVAEEAAVTAELFGNRVERLYDVGVSGIHRLLSKTELIQNSNAIVAVAGMEGALPSVIAGFAGKPVIAVPTSVGYGANFGGVSALLTMLNSCAAGISVVNIDNGFGAGFLAGMINRQSKEEK